MSTLPPRHHFFLENVNYHLIQHLSDPQLSVKRLIRLVGMSRTDLHRKLTMTVGMSTTAYIRQKRLHTAAKLLLDNPKWGVYRVALEVGFTNPSYFSRRFKEMFGASPTDWRSSQTRRRNLN